ncbi:helix-hairpin-helix domain-containing protein [Priestia megaterium]|uniref:helix-hairpin-helix domain-containing protein n=1 Tax=Priestia megaterium TaxID=1404 RepID=UPI001F498EA5|nr:helix-hairpin-helix domain-containing protein [Priestia megaterium]MDI3094722.1 helix-hairpin-helix domain-containing protein [Priestia megaterium]MEC1066916.1 helix-hairpin-helix domain-containing protein [Priestia megaterium]MED3862313.1 helix-hairpin-helix domain-containing protein [Priestia megaterium]MED4100157.1 helix-hairpin-helix domain-containing protein [Priestia megaterium]MED4142971.1 helix-hairpin-helix domain-containing protein [Priestia megaterium]
MYNLTFSKKQWLIGCICLAVGLAFYIYRTGGEKSESSLQTSDMIKAESSTAKKEEESSDQVNSSQDSPFVMVDIKGAVQKPGVYQLPKDARVKDALAQAGGATKEANLRQLNLASKLQDEMAVYIPAAGEEIPPSSPVSSISSSGTSNDQPLVNINTANTDELQTLNGIGPSKASAIVSYREENGLFQTVEDLGKVSGIGEKSLEKIKAQITVQ